MSHAPFEALTISHYYAGGGEYTTTVNPTTLEYDSGIVMEITTDQEIVYITKQQAMDFFGLFER